MKDVFGQALLDFYHHNFKAPLLLHNEYGPPEEIPIERYFIKEEAYANEPDEDHRDIDYMQNKLAGGMNRPKGTHPKVADGDNPMKKVKEGDDLRAQIKAELAQRLAEAKGEK